MIDSLLASRGRARSVRDTLRAHQVDSRIVDTVSGYGVVNAVTHYSQEVEDYDRATELEALGGKLIELGAGEWQEIAEAA